MKRRSTAADGGAPSTGSNRAGAVESDVLRGRRTNEHLIADPSLS
jgi:hypothetical protein